MAKYIHTSCCGISKFNAVFLTAAVIYTQHIIWWRKDVQLIVMSDIGVELQLAFKSLVVLHPPQSKTLHSPCNLLLVHLELPFTGALTFFFSALLTSVLLSSSQMGIPDAPKPFSKHSHKHLLQTLPLSLGWTGNPWRRYLRRYPGEGNSYPLQHSRLENSMNRGAWLAIVHGVTKSRTQLSN